MNCDDAFDALTDATRRGSPELQWHLDLCPRCRQMRDVLEPALDLFDAPAPPLDVTAGACEDTANIRPFLTPEMVQLAERTASELRRVSASPCLPRRRRGLAANAAAVVVAGLLLGAVILGLSAGTAGVRNDEAAHRRAAAGCTWNVPAPHGDSADEPSARAVVLSCMACHLGGPVE